MTDQPDFTIPCLQLTDSYYDCNSIGRAAKAQPKYREGVYWYRHDEKLQELTRSDIWNAFEIPRAFGSTTQGDTLHDITPEIADRLRALNADRAAAKAAQEQVERNRTKAIRDLIAAIPKEVQVERRRLEQEYHKGMLEGGDGYNPYAGGWFGPSSLSLLRKQCPDIARQIEALSDE